MLGGFVTYYAFAVIVTASALMAALYVFLKFARTGQAMRAVAQDPDAAALRGVNIEAVLALGFGVGCALAGAAGALLAPVFAVSPTMGALPVVKAFVIIIIGGMGSLPGAVLRGPLLGTLGGGGLLFLRSAAGSVPRVPMVIARLLVRPRRLVG